MSTPTVTELKDFIDSKKITFEGYSEYPVQGLTDIFYKLAETLNAKKTGYRYLKAVVLAEQFSSTESVNIQDPQTKLIAQDNQDMSALTIARVSAGKYKVTTGYNDGTTANLRDNGRVTIQPFHDLPTYDYLKSGSSTYPADDIGIATVVDFTSAGIFDVYLSDSGTLKDVNFYITIELFNMPTV